MFEQLNPDFLPKIETKVSHLDTFTRSVASESHPQRNEDSHFLNKDNYSFGVFDGMGGLPNPAEVSTLAKNKTESGLKLIHSSDVLEAKQVIKSVFSQTQQAVLDYAQKLGSTVGTTGLFGSLITQESGNYQALFCHIGDSRLYVYHNKSLDLITQDHSVLYKDKPEGYQEIQDFLDNYDGSQPMTPIQRIYFRNRHFIYNYFGCETAKPAYYKIDLFPGDILIACTDGIHDNLTHKDMNISVMKNKKRNAQAICDGLIEQAQIQSREKNPKKNPRAKSDDMTIIAVKI